MQLEQPSYGGNIFNCTGDIEVKVIPSYSCDTNCSFCYNKFIDKRYFEPDRKRIIATLDRLFLDPGVNAIVEIIGGDPLSRVNFPETQAIIRHLNSLDRDVKLVLQTASSSLERITELLPEVDALSYSIDLSGSPKVKNLENLEMLVSSCLEHNITVQIQTMLGPGDSLEEISNFIRRCAALGVRYMGLEYPQYQRYGRAEMDRQIEVYAGLFGQFSEFKGFSLGGIFESVVDFLDGVSYSSPCMCGEKSVTVQPDGSVSPSFHFEFSKLLSFNDFLICKSLRAERLREGECSGCELWRVCRGGCMEHARFLTGDLYSRDMEFCYQLSGLIKKIRSSGSGR